jgi:hypothetical protein
MSDSVGVGREPAEGISGHIIEEQCGLLARRQEGSEMSGEFFGVRVFAPGMGH